MHNGDGICIYLKGNLCSIYQSRPLICRIDDAYDVFFKEKMTLEEYYKLNKEACENLNNQKNANKKTILEIKECQTF